MSVLIKGMEMPKNCIDCAFGWNGWCHRINSRAFVEVDMRRHDCPLVELPPHGRLIDADALHDQMLDYVADGYANDADDCEAYYDMVKDAPTIIPAEGVDT